MTKATFASLFSGGGGFDLGAIAAGLTQNQVVAMTLRALARLQAFDNEYQLPESHPIACRIIGNACPPLMFEKLILSTLGGADA